MNTSWLTVPWIYLQISTWIHKKICANFTQAEKLISHMWVGEGEGVRNKHINWKNTYNTCHVLTRTDHGKSIKTAKTEKVKSDDQEPILEPNWNIFKVTLLHIYPNRQVIAITWLLLTKCMYSLDIVRVYKNKKKQFNRKIANDISHTTEIKFTGNII